MSYDYDVIFLGSGHACWHAALTLASAGKKLAVVEEDRVSGTCTNWGCNAKYLLDTPFDFVEGLNNFRGRGTVSAGEIDWHELMDFKKSNIGPMYLSMEENFAKAGIDLVKAHGRLVGAHEVQADDARMTAEFIVIGTGEHANRRDVPGKELMHDSRDFLDLDPFPARIAFIGAGVISLEFACIAAKLGAETTVVHHNDRALRAWPERYVGMLVEKMRADGVEFAFNENLARVEKTPDGAIVLTFESGNSMECDYVVDASGRTPNVNDIGLEDVGIDFSRRGIKVDDRLRTTVPNVYASGDVIDKRIPKLTPTAEFESNYIASQILGNDEPIDYPVIPHVVFTLPRIAQLGVGVDEALANPEKYDVKELPLGQWSAFLAKCETDTEFTCVFDKESQLLVGAALYGTDATELANLLAMIVNLKLRREDLQKMVFTFPSTTYGMLTFLLPLMP